MYVCMNTYMYIYLVSKYIYMNELMFVHICLYVYIKCVRMCVFLCVCMCVCV